MDMIHQCPKVLPKTKIDRKISKICQRVISTEIELGKSVVLVYKKNSNELVFLVLVFIYFILNLLPNEENVLLLQRIKVMYLLRRVTLV